MVILKRALALFVSAGAVVLLLSGCGDGDSASGSTEEAVTTYADGVLASYEASLESAAALDTAVGDFVAAPSAATLDAAKQAWLSARGDYGLTEAFRFYGGPIDDAETGTEGLINAWPLDEAYIDYVEGDPTAGVVNDAAGYPTIDDALLESLNEQGGEANISTGWHAIEFLLWGQDLDETGPGARPVEDYTTSEGAERRAQYLSVTSDLLVQHLTELVAAWQPDADNYRAEFEGADPGEAMRRMFTGIGELSRGELAGERMNVAYTERSQEDEHSCFSDNTTADLLANALGIQMVLTGQYPGGVSGTGLLDAIAEEDEDLSTRLRDEVAASVAAIEAIPAPFDQHLAEGVPDDDPGRASILAAIEALEAQTPTIVDGASALGVTVNVS